MKKKRSFPHTYVIVFSFVVLAGMLTWLIPGGSFSRETVVVDDIEREVIKGGSFSYTENVPQTWQIFSALFDGFVDKSDIIVFILLIGGAFWIMNHTKAIDVGIYTFLKVVKRIGKSTRTRQSVLDDIVIVLLMILFSIFGAVFGMSEETLAFIIIFVPLAIKMGYDSITGLAMCFIGASLGFAGAILNPFTIGIAQGLSQLPLFSGIGYRMVCWFVINIAGISYVLWYVGRIRKNPMKSPVWESDKVWRDSLESHDVQVDYHTPRPAWYSMIALTIVMAAFSYLYPVSHIKIGQSQYSLMLMPILTLAFLASGVIALRKSVHFYILNLLIFTILILIVGVMGYSWYIMEIATLFFVMGLSSGWAMAYSVNKITSLFLDGVRDILSAAMIVGLAGGIIVILQNGNIIDTLLYYVSQSMSDLGEFGSVSMMYIIQTGINMFLPSGSAKAALTMPIMSQFSDLIGVSRQATVMAYQFGDGFTNMLTPASGVTMGVLGIAKIPYDKWLKWIVPLMIILVLLGFLLLIPTVTMELDGF